MAEAIRLVDVTYSRAEAQEQAQRNLEAMNLDGLCDDPRRDFMAAVGSDLPPRAKLNHLKKSTAKLSKLAMPFSACKSGCSYCCHISVMICESEAKALAKASGRKMQKITERPSLAIREKWHKVPCTFLKKGRCSVYEERPLACRMTFNMADTPEQCNTDVPSKDSYVMLLNFQQLEHGFAQAFLNESWGDIRDFFPPA